MYNTKNSIPESTRFQICELLQESLANSIDLTTHIKQAHWNVKGPDFIALHELFDRVAHDSLNYSDLLAERIVQMGSLAEGTLRNCVKRSSLPDYPTQISSAHAHIQALGTSLAHFGGHIRSTVSKSSEFFDFETIDILTEISRSTSKNLWFIEAHNQL